MLLLENIWEMSSFFSLVGRMVLIQAELKRSAIEICFWSILEMLAKIWAFSFWNLILYCWFWKVVLSSAVLKKSLENFQEFSLIDMIVLVLTVSKRSAILILVCVWSMLTKIWAFLFGGFNFCIVDYERRWY